VQSRDFQFSILNFQFPTNRPRTICRMRRLLLLATLVAAIPAAAVTVDRIAAVVDRQVLTVSEITQMVELRFFPRSSESEDDHRHDVLDALIAQALRARDAERFGQIDIPADAIEARVVEIQNRFKSIEDFSTALTRTEITGEELRTLVKRQLQVEAYIQERFAPLVFVSNEEIETYYRGPWSEGRRQRGLPIPSLASVREEVRTAVRASRLQAEVDRWTAQLRARANVDVYAWR
jgi:hypothetical protein